MKWSHIVLLTAPAALALPSQRPRLELQSDLLKGFADAEVGVSRQIAELDVEAFQTIQKEATGGFLHLSEAAVEATNELIEAAAVVDDSRKAATVRPPHYIDFTQYTILEILNASLHRKPDEPKDRRPHWLPRWPGHGPPKPPTDPAELPLHRLGWLVNRSAEAQDLLGKDKITLLAPDDGALTPPHRRRHGHHDRHSVDGQAGSTEVEIKEEMEALPMGHPFHSRLFRDMYHAEDEAVQDDDHDEDRARKISKIIGYIGAYHILDHVETAFQLANHSTLGTSLEKQRIHVDPTWALHPFPHPTIKFNFYSYKRGLSIKAKNGIIHLISAPLLPPLSPLNEAFLFPTFFSTLTSSIQKVGLDEPLLPPHRHEGNGFDLVDVLASLVDDLKEKDTPFTIFAPTNWAWNKIGLKGLAFLNSPFPLSKVILKYILSYHVVPDIAFYSDYIHNVTSLSPYVVREETNVEVDASWLLDTSSVSLDNEPQSAEEKREVSILLSWPRWGKKDPQASHPPPPHHPHPHGKVNVTHYSLPTLLVTSGVNPNASLPVAVISYRKFGKGPVQRAVVVLPHHDHEHDHEHKDVKAECGHHGHGHGDREHHGPPPARPVKAIKADVPARNGAIHVVPTLLRPPRYHHSDNDKTEAIEAMNVLDGRHGGAMKGLFA